MEKIYASKMFKSSKNKEKIRASIADPVNAELVQQLREYLDDEYLTPEYFGEPSGEPASQTEDGSEVDTGDEELDTTSTESADTEDSNAGDGTDEFGQGEEPANDTGDDDQQIAEATRIQASTGCAVDLSSLPEVLKGSLNLRQDTAGVVRVACKDNELWIYYNDKTNLNNVMGPVIDLLNSSSYTYLEFNRLARTDNAMVFEISLSCTNPVKPISGEADGE